MPSPCGPERETQEPTQDPDAATDSELLSVLTQKSHTSRWRSHVPYDSSEEENQPTQPTMYKPQPTSRPILSSIQNKPTQPPPNKDPEGRYFFLVTLSNIKQF